MKRFFLSLLVIISGLTTEGQTWRPVGSGVLMKTVTDKPVMEDYDARPVNDYISALAVYKGELYAGGIFKTIGGKKVRNIARWNGTGWSAAGEGINGIITSLCVYKDELYAAGTFDTAGNIRADNIARWDGSKWSAVGGGIDMDVNTLTVHRDQLYAGGSFTMAGSKPAKNIARWNGLAWSAIGHGMHNDVYSLTEFNGDLYAGGTFVVVEGEVEDNVHRWNDKRWSGAGAFNGAVYALTTHKGKLCAGGHFGRANHEDVSFVAEGNGVDWQAVGKGIGYHTPQNEVSALCSEGDTLYAAGRFKSTNENNRTLSNIARWNGTDWSAMSTGIDGSVYALAVYNGELYAGGYFIKAGSSDVNCIARWKLK